MNCVWGVTKVFLASSPPRRRWTSVGGWSWCTGSIACQRTGRWCHRSWRSSAWPRPCSRRPSWRSALRRSSSRPNTGWTSAPWASTPGMFPPLPASQLPALNSQLLDLASHDSACFLPLASEGSWSWASPRWSCAWRAPATTSSTPQTWCTAPTRTFGVSLTPSLSVEMLRHFFKI